LKYHPLYLILSALEYDHIDFFPDENLYIKSFQNLVNQVPGNGLIILNRDYPMNRQVVEKALTPILTYGINDCDYVLHNISYDPRSGYYRFILKNGSKEAAFTSKIPGRYNLWNETAGIILGFRLGIPEKTIRQAVESFAGVERRLNIINRVGETIFLEDFAHHPTSIKNVLQSLKESFPEKRIITLFEPRSWSLRRNFFQDRLSESFLDCHEIIIKEVFQKEKIPGPERLDVHRIKQELEQQGKTVKVIEHGKEIEDYLLQLDYSRENLVVILSNGSFDNIPAFVKHLQEHLPQSNRNK
jgi:UDP-N-acetylmuramate: L-alanyl-gamma-D-glutamyl-meso-diaminopimelate ligase